MPGIIEDYQKKQTIVGLRTAYSIFSQAIERSKQENGDLSTWDYTLSVQNLPKKYILPYIENFGLLKYRYLVSGLIYNNGDNYNINWAIDNNQIYILKNGMTFAIPHISHKILSVDINGQKGPNRMGRDVFVFTISPNVNRLALKGEGLSKDQLRSDYAGNFSSCNKNASPSNIRYSGSYCGALIMQDGWQIKSDYPW